MSGYLIGSQEAGKAPLPPKAEFEWWYQFYFATERGLVGYDKYRRDFAKLIWRLASPKWDFDDATFDRTAVAFDNPDHVAIVIHNYRWRIDVAKGEAKYDDLEKRLAEGPVITVPTITLESDANGAPHPDPSSYRQEVLGQICASAHQGRHRAQSAPGSSAGLRGSDHRRRREVSGASIRPADRDTESAGGKFSDAENPTLLVLSTGAAQSEPPPIMPGSSPASRRRLRRLSRERRLWMRDSIPASVLTRTTKVKA